MRTCDFHRGSASREVSRHIWFHTVVNLLRRLLKLALLAGLGYAVYRLISEVQPADEPRVTPADEALRATTRTGDADDTTERRDRAGTSPGGATRPASSPAQPAPASVRSIGVGEVPADAQKWVEPESDGECPVSHPVKANMESGIFHVPEGRHYERTKADRCYRDPDTAEAEGLRQSKQ